MRTALAKVSVMSIIGVLPSQRYLLVSTNNNQLGHKHPGIHKTSVRASNFSLMLNLEGYALVWATF
jgi:hypothetical protein